ncbi:PH domain-containing protein [Actinokineospora bangkokensis]|uniref:YdbS-like PH domain-containing protein n=1 Tax=Actinokineospora bangkokensis TaxID=1193682 RepID=A0A1Q9LBW8_9PSEU|nr:PH domain-containing protein [Actinokineospora bangkokensis]OLR89505.1 hypothetical protein BJP25_05340 [Actinokineospora bangkokensis]
MSDDLGGAGLRLRAPANLVSRRAVAHWAVRAGLVWAVLVLGQAAPGLLGFAVPDWLRLTALATAVLGAAHVVVMPRWRYRVHRWETTGDAVFTRSGWFTQDWRIAPVSRVQTVDTERGPLQRLFGLATVTVTTASAQGPVSIEGLDEATAARLVDELTSTTQATRGDAT